MFALSRVYFSILGFSLQITKICQRFTVNMWRCVPRCVPNWHLRSVITSTS